MSKLIVLATLLATLSGSIVGNYDVRFTRKSPIRGHLDVKYGIDCRRLTKVMSCRRRTTQRSIDGSDWQRLSEAAHAKCVEE